MRTNHGDRYSFLVDAYDEQELCNPLLGGLLLEQAALCCLYVNPPQFRKFNMHLVFAGDRFRAAGQLEHSLGCYKAAHAAYHGRRWMLLDDHTSAAIARSSYYLNDIDRATEYAANLLAEGSPAPANVQSSYLREFVHILQVSMAAITLSQCAMSE